MIVQYVSHQLSGAQLNWATRRYHQPLYRLHHNIHHQPHLHINQYRQPLIDNPQLRIIHPHNTHHKHSNLNQLGNNRPEPRKKVGTHSNYKPYHMQTKSRRPPHPSHFHVEPMEVSGVADMNTQHYYNDTPV